MQNKYKIKNFTCVMPMAGEGLRFKRYGYKLSKPLIKIKHLPMFIQATKTFPFAFKWIFVANKKVNPEYILKKHTKKIKKKKISFR